MIKSITKIVLCLFLLLFTGCYILVDTTTLDFGSVETEKTFELKIIGFVEWSINCDKRWVTVNPEHSQLGKPSQTITVTVDRTGLDTGNYEATLTISNNWNIPCPDVLIKMTIEEEESSTVEGCVYDEKTDDPISGVLVSIGTNNYTTNDNGYYIVAVPTPGLKTITASKKGYEDYSADITVDEGIVQHNIYIVSIEVGTPDLMVKDIVPGFEQVVEESSITYLYGIKITICNIGKYSTFDEVEIEISGLKKYDFTLDNLALEGQECYSKVVAYFPVIGVDGIEGKTYDIKAEVDPNDKIIEIDEGNNFLEKTIKVPTCGNYLCEEGETYKSCPFDCEVSCKSEFCNDKVLVYCGCDEYEVVSKGHG